MRAAVLLSLLLLPAAAANAQPDMARVPVDEFADAGQNRPDLSLSPRQLFNGMRHERERPLLLGGEPAAAPNSQPAISVMPAAFDPHAFPGRRKHSLSPRYRIGGLRLFGGSLGGSIGTRSASVSLSWQTDR
ncbi:MAG TPA: hypothetical protein VGM17_16455 [Rhizomicrobium sp.]|jgi:hypothetical protein